MASGGRLPSGSCAELAERLKEARELALEAVRWTSKLDFPELDEDYEFVALSDPEDYPLERGRLVSSRGLDIAPDEYERALRRGARAPLERAALPAA